MTTSWKRASARLLLVQAAQLLVSLAFLVVALLFWRNHGSAIAAVLLPLAVFVYAPLRLTWIFVRWRMETYLNDPDKLAIRTGVIRRKERHLGWSSIVAVDEQAGLFFRVLGIRRLQLTQSDSVGGSVVLRALEPQAAADIRQSVRDHNGADTAPDIASHLGVVYQASWRELALMSIVNGRFALLAPPVLFACWRLLEDVGVTTWAIEILKSLPPLLLIALSIIGFVIVGTLTTITRYQGFSARLTTDSALVLSYGLVEKRERHIDLKSIEGISVRRSLVEQLLRRSRLAVLTVKGTDDLGASLVLPSLPDKIVRQIARSHFHDFVQDAAILPDRSAPVLRQLFRIVTVFVVPVALAVRLLDIGASIIIATLASLVVLGITTSIGRMLVLRISVDSHDVLKVERLLVTEMETYVRARSCHSAWSIHLRANGRPLCFSILLYAGGARNVVGMHCSAETEHRLRTVIASVKEPAAWRQRSQVKTTGTAP